MPTAHTNAQHFFLVLFFIKCFENFPKDLKIYGKDCVEWTSKSLRGNFLGSESVLELKMDSSVLTVLAIILAMAPNTLEAVFFGSTQSNCLTGQDCALGICTINTNFFCAKASKFRP